MILDVATVTQNLTNVVANQAIKSVTDEITDTIIRLFFEWGLALLAGLGASRRDLGELRKLLGVIAMVSAVIGAIEILGLIPLILQAATP